MSSKKISKKLLYQRIRNRIIEVLEVASDPSQHEKFGDDEILCLWEDWVDDQRISEYVEPVFSLEEQAAISDFHKTWNEVVENTPHSMPLDSELQNGIYWQKLIDKARKALAILSVKRRYNEEIENT